MSVFSVLNGYARRYWATAQRRRTEYLIGTLPPEIRKDIGWPDHYRAALRRPDGMNNAQSQH